MRTKIELIKKFDETPGMIGMLSSKISKVRFHRYYFPPIRVDFFESAIIDQKVIETIEINGTAIDNFTFCLKINERSNNEAKAFTFASRYIAENWYNVYKKSWWNKKWKLDKETKAKIKFLTITGNEAIVSFGT